MRYTAEGEAAGVREGALVRDGCPFCDFDGKIAYQVGGADLGPGRPGGIIVFEPLNPVTPGHMLVVPRRHVRDAMEDPEVTARVFQVAAEYARYRSLPGFGQFNFISSAGEDATQTVFHLHVHVVPRRRDDGLVLPWTGQSSG